MRREEPAALSLPLNDDMKPMTMTRGFLPALTPRPLSLSSSARARSKVPPGVENAKKMVCKRGCYTACTDQKKGEKGGKFLLGDVMMMVSGKNFLLCTTVPTPERREHHYSPRLFSLPSQPAPTLAARSAFSPARGRKRGRDSTYRKPLQISQPIQPAKHSPGATHAHDTRRDGGEEG